MFTNLGRIDDDGKLIQVLRILGVPYETESGAKRIAIEDLDGTIISTPVNRIVEVALRKVYPYA